MTHSASRAIDKLDGEENADPVCRRPGDGDRTVAASRRFVHSLECAEPGWLQTELLREQDLLRCLQEKHDPGLAASLQKRRLKPASCYRLCLRSGDRFDR